MAHHLAATNASWTLTQPTWSPEFHSCRMQGLAWTPTGSTASRRSTWATPSTLPSWTSTPATSGRPWTRRQVGLEAPRGSSRQNWLLRHGCVTIRYGKVDEDCCCSPETPCRSKVSEVARRCRGDDDDARASAVSKRQAISWQGNERGLTPPNSTGKDGFPAVRPRPSWCPCAGWYPRGLDADVDGAHRVAASRTGPLTTTPDQPLCGPARR